MKNVCEYRYKHLHTCLFTYICLERQWNLGQRGKVLVFLAMMCRLWDLLHGEKEALIFREVVSGKWPAVCLHPAHTSKTFENAPQWSPMAQDLCGLSREEIMLKITRTEFSVFHTSTMNCWVLTRCHFLPCKMQGANEKNYQVLMFPLSFSTTCYTSSESTPAWLVLINEGISLAW